MTPDDNLNGQRQMVNMWVNIKNCINIFCLFSSLSVFKRHKLCKAVIITLYYLVYNIHKYDVYENNSTKGGENILKQICCILLKLSQEKPRVKYDKLSHIIPKAITKETTKNI